MTFHSPFDQPSYGKKKAKKKKKKAKARKKAKKKVAKKVAKRAPKKKAAKKKAKARKKAKKKVAKKRPAKKARSGSQYPTRNYELNGPFKKIKTLKSGAQLWTYHGGRIPSGYRLPTKAEILEESPSHPDPGWERRRMVEKQAAGCGYVVKSGTGGAKKRAAAKSASGPGIKVVRGIPYCETCGKKCALTDGRFGQYWACSTTGCLGSCPQHRKSGEWTLPKKRPASFAQTQYVANLQEKIGLTQAKFKALVKKTLGKAKAISGLSKKEISAVIDALKDVAIGEGIAVRGRSLRGRHEASAGYQRGEKIVFGSPEGEKTLAVITRVNDRTLSVRTLEERGGARRLPAGQKWGVPYTWVRKATKSEASSGRAVQSYTRSPRRRRKRGHGYMGDYEGNPKAKMVSIHVPALMHRGRGYKAPKAFVKKFESMLRAVPGLEIVPVSEGWGHPGRARFDFLVHLMRDHKDSWMRGGAKAVLVVSDAQAFDPEKFLRTLESMYAKIPKAGRIYVDSAGGGGTMGLARSGDTVSDRVADAVPEWRGLGLENTITQVDDGWKISSKVSGPPKKGRRSLRRRRNPPADLNDHGAFFMVGKEGKLAGTFGTVNGAADMIIAMHPGIRQDPFLWAGFKGLLSSLRQEPPGTVDCFHSTWPIVWFDPKRDDCESPLDDWEAYEEAMAHAGKDAWA